MIAATRGPTPMTARKNKPILFYQKGKVNASDEK